MENDSFAFVTLATDDKYAIGALVLGHSLKRVETKAKLVVIVTDGVSQAARAKLGKVFDLVDDVAEIDSRDNEKLSKLDRPELGVTFTKIHAWKLTQFSKGVFLDADTLVLKNCDELFDKPQLSAVPDIGWPDCFNSGVFVFEPSPDTYYELITLASEKGSFDGGDQGLLNMYFSEWATKDISNHLSFIYNMSISTLYSYLPAYERYGKDVKIVHFLGSQKPWTFRYNKQMDRVDGVNYPLSEFLQLWWKIWSEKIDDGGQGIEEYFKRMDFSSPSSSQDAESPKGGTSSPDSKKVPSDEERLNAWEQGRADYLGIDSYKNIEKKLDEVMESKEKQDKEQKKRKKKK